jgi:hypothetical protein
MNGGGLRAPPRVIPAGDDHVIYSRVRGYGTLDLLREVPERGPLSRATYQGRRGQATSPVGREQLDQHIRQRFRVPVASFGPLKAATNASA